MRVFETDADDAMGLARHCLSRASTLFPFAFRAIASVPPTPAPTIGVRAIESKRDLLPSRAMHTYRNIAWLVLLALLWSITFGLVKVALEIPPLTMTALRLVIAALLVVAYLYARGERLSAPSSTWLYFGVIAFFALVVPFNALVYAETRISSGLASINRPVR